MSEKNKDNKPAEETTKDAAANTGTNAGEKNANEATAKAAEDTVTKELVLSDGRVAKVLKTLGKHVMQAQARVGKGDMEEKLLPVLIAMRTVIDGKKIVIEDLENMAGKDYLLILGEFAEKNF